MSSRRASSALIASSSRKHAWWTMRTPVRAGCLADLLVLDGDPTDDITLLQQPERRRAVVKGGAFAYVDPQAYP